MTSSRSSQSVLKYPTNLELTPYIRADSRFASSKWETTILCNDISHLLGASLESALFNLILTSELNYLLRNMHTIRALLYFTVACCKSFTHIHQGYVTDISQFTDAYMWH